jgi:lycopene cyclase domain-containing protein
MQWLYLVALLIGIAGMLTIDHRWKLGFFKDTKRTTLTVVVAMLIFIVWDYFGISLGIFFHGGSRYTLPLRLAPEFPLEELFFLFLLTYSTLIIYHGVQLWRSRI